MAHLTQITNMIEFAACIKSTAGKTLLLAYWPEDAMSNEAVAALQKLLPASEYEKYNVVDIYCFDMYSLPELGALLDVSFVPTLYWFQDGVQDPIEWHEEYRLRGKCGEGREEGRGQG
ncbi:hypothetical protein Ptr902_14151 [Pyrenophora tritici-repentis]|nr:hypothetical protein Ptr902_14151 [Pyrenophora tritici-repentis]